MGGWVSEMGWPGVTSPHGLAPFPLGIWTGPFPVWDMDRPLVYMVIHLVRLPRSISFCPLCPQTSFANCHGVDHGDRVFYTRSARLRVPAKVVCLLHDGHVELEYDQGGVRVVNHRCPMGGTLSALRAPLA